MLLHRLFLQVLCIIMAGYLCTLVHEFFRIHLSCMYIVLSVSSDVHTHIHLHTLTTLTHTGSDHLTLLTEHGDIYTLGCAEQGQIGRVPECFSSRGGRKGTSLLLRPDIVRFRVTEEPNLPTQVEGLKGVKVVTVAAGGACSFFVTATGELYGWGMGTNLQLGMSDEEDVWTPERVTGKKMENRRTLAVSVGGQHTALLVSNSD